MLQNVVECEMLQKWLLTLTRLFSL